MLEESLGKYDTNSSMRLIRVGEFVDFVSEASFDLNDGVGAEAFAFGKVGGGFDVVDAGVKDFAVEWGKFVLI